MLRLIAPLLMVLLSLPVNAELQPYAEARLGAGGVRHSDLDFFPGFASFSAGVFLFENIGVEAFVDTQVSSDQASVFDLVITQAAGAAVRFQSPAMQGVRAYLLFGYVDFTLEQEENGVLGQRTVSQSFDGFRFSVGVQQQLQSFPGFIVGLDYRNYFSDSGITVDGLSIGLRYELP